ncbi:MAG: aminotransferase class V-fold PLP-dependent enzyme [Candidatus Latescibacteria bacterium]|nr:aminotransferase class V-fold PLP-dependent enzyme [Candidatus Latescibacterota bacterium]
MTQDLQYPTYEDIGIRPLINGRGTYTIISGSVILPEVRQAMYAASERYVHMDELMEAVGRRIGELMQCEWGLVTNGCAAALCQITAAAVAGSDPEKMARLPDTSGMANQVIVQKSHRHTYDHAVRMVGIEMVEVETRAEMEAALSERTAMLLLFGDAAERGAISVKEMAEFGQAHGIPSFVDAAAERPDAPNWYLAQGVDAVGYSGGKCLRGPQAGGLVLGRKDLLQAAFLNAAPHHALARPMKVGKEEIMGMLAAVEMWVRRDHPAEWREWERRLQVVADAVGGLPSVTTHIRLPGRSNVAPVIAINWDPAKISGGQVERQLSDGEPRISVFSHAEGISVMPYMMQEGDEVVVARRLGEILQPVLG